MASPARIEIARSSPRDDAQARRPLATPAKDQNAADDSGEKGKGARNAENELDADQDHEPDLPVHPFGRAACDPECGKDSQQHKGARAIVNSTSRPSGVLKSKRTPVRIGHSSSEARQAPVRSWIPHYTILIATPTSESSMICRDLTGPARIALILVM